MHAGFLTTAHRHVTGELRLPVVTPLILIFQLSHKSQSPIWRKCNRINEGDVEAKKVKFIDFIIVALSKEKAPEQGRECINLKAMVATPPLVEPCNACNEAKYEVIFKGWILHHPRCWPETRRRSVGEVFAAVDEPNANSLLPSGSSLPAAVETVPPHTCQWLFSSRTSMITRPSSSPKGTMSKSTRTRHRGWQSIEKFRHRTLTSQTLPTLTFGTPSCRVMKTES